MFSVKDSSELEKPWILSKKGTEDPDVIPSEVKKFLTNYHMKAIRFVYRKYRQRIKGFILNEEPGMNFPLQMSAFFRAVVKDPEVVLVICPQESISFWRYHLTVHGGFAVFRICANNSKNNYEADTEKLALLVETTDIELCEDLKTIDFFSVVIENFDQVVDNTIIKELEGECNIGLTCRNFSIEPDQKLQLEMLMWANPSCARKQNEFYKKDNDNFEYFHKNYGCWWMHLTWRKPFVKPSAEELKVYERVVAEWVCQNPFDPSEDTLFEDNITVNQLFNHENVQLRSRDKGLLLDSIIKNLESTSEPSLHHVVYDFPYFEPNIFDKEVELDELVSLLSDEETPCSCGMIKSQGFITNSTRNPEKDVSDNGDDEKVPSEVVQLFEFDSPLYKWNITNRNDQYLKCLKLLCCHYIETDIPCYSSN